jgi:hypothetical protein
MGGQYSWIGDIGLALDSFEIRWNGSRMDKEVWRGVTAMSQCAPALIDLRMDTANARASNAARLGAASD